MVSVIPVILFFSTDLITFCSAVINIYITGNMVNAIFIEYSEVQA